MSSPISCDLNELKVSLHKFNIFVITEFNRLIKNMFDMLCISPNWPFVSKTGKDFLSTVSQVYSEPRQKSKMGLFAKVVHSVQPLIIYAKKLDLQGTLMQI